MRTKITTELVCEKHPDVQLEIVSDDIKTTAHSAYEAGCIIKVLPCRVCEREKDKIRIAFEKSLKELGYQKT